MSISPIALALREIEDTRNLLSGLITSSETFDYVTAKGALRALERKMKHLERIQAQLEGFHRARAVVAPNVRVVDFTRQAATPRGSRTP